MTAWWIYASIVLCCIAAGIYVSGRVARRLELKDPAVIVIDEFVGLWVALFLLPSGWFWPLIGLLLFRFFDILKPWPISWCDRELEGGYGIVLDDVVAGLFTFGLIQIAVLLLERL